MELKKGNLYKLSERWFKEIEEHGTGYYQKDDLFVCLLVGDISVHPQLPSSLDAVPNVLRLYNIRSRKEERIHKNWLVEA